MSSRIRHHEHGPADPLEIANTIVYLASEDASFVNGAIVPVDGGQVALLDPAGTRARRGPLPCSGLLQVRVVGAR